MTWVAHPRCFITSLSCKLCLSFFSKLWPNSRKSHYRPPKNIKNLTEKSPLQKTFSKNRELVKIWNDHQIARWDPNPDFTKLHMSFIATNFVECGDTSCVINLIWTASCNSFDYLSVHEWCQVLDRIKILKSVNIEFLQVQISSPLCNFMAPSNLYKHLSSVQFGAPGAVLSRASSYATSSSLYAHLSCLMCTL